MNKLFSFESPIITTLTLVADLAIISFMWILFCLPVFTIGASTTAMYRVALNLADDKGGPTVGQFWAAFKSNFKSGTLLFLASFPIYLIIAFDIWMLSAAKATGIMAFACVMSALVLGFIGAYIFPLNAQFDNSVKNTLKNAFAFSMTHPLTSVLVLFIDLIPVLILVLLPDLFWFSALIWPFFGFGAIARLNTTLFRRVFRKYISDEPKED